MSRKEYYKKYREEHREEIRKYNREWQKEHPDKIRESQKRYREKHPDKVKEIAKCYYENNREELLVKMRQYNGKNDRGLKQVNFIMDVTNDRRLMPLFEDILVNREIAEIDIKIKYFNRANED